MFAIDWLREGVPVERETSVLASAVDAIAAARARAAVVATRHPGREPDSLRLIDATGTILGVFRVHDLPNKFHAHHRPTGTSGKVAVPRTL